MTTPNPTLSPFWLRVNDEWVHLEGVAPGWTRSPSRPSSEFTSVGGRRHIQVAPRVSREWTLDFEFATPSALAALAVAAEVNGEVWLHDVTAARANMLDPRDCYGHDQTADTMIVDGTTPLRCITWLPTSPHVAFRTPLRFGYRYGLSCWTNAPENDQIALLAGVSPWLAPVGTGVRMATYTFVSAGTLLDWETYSGAWAVTGLQMVEDLPYADSWMPGQRTPCQVSVNDPERAHVITIPGLCQADRGLSRDDWTLTVREVD